MLLIMSFFKCINDAVADGRISADVGNALKEDISAEASRRAKSESLPQQEADRQASDFILSNRQQNVDKKKQQAALQALAIERNLEIASKHPKGFGRGVLSLLVKDTQDLASNWNVDNQTSAMLGVLHSQFADGLAKMRPKFLGLVPEREGLRDMVRALFGEASDDADIKAIADSWKNTTEMARKQFNRVGGDIPKRDDWGMPQHHDQKAVSSVGVDKWKADIKPLLNIEQMELESGRVFDDKALDEFLDYIYADIATDGLASMIPGRQGGGKLANRRSDQRVLAFKNADSWLDYQESYGGGMDLFTVMTTHLQGMSRDIAMLEIMGPNPESNFKLLRDTYQIKAANEGVSKKRSDTRLYELDAVWNVVSGKTSQPQVAWFSNFMDTVRNLLISSKLGGAALSAVSDIGFLHKTAQYNGMSSAKTANRMVSLLNPANEEDRVLAVKMGLVAENWITDALAANRLAEVTGATKSGKVADVVMRLSGLNAWTDSGRKAFGMEFNGFIADNMDKSFGSIDGKLKESFDRYGITEKDWSDISSTKALEHKGAKFFGMQNLMERGDLSEARRIELSAKVNRMILTETDYAVPTPDAFVRAITTGGGLKKGTIGGEVSRAIGMFKSFPITVINTHLMRGMAQEGFTNKAGYLGSVLTSTTVLGVLAMDLKEIARGKEPRPLSPEKLQAGFLQGGGLGIFGDFIFQDANRFGGGFFSTLSGPIGGLFDDAHKLVIGNAQEAATGEDTNAMSELGRMMGAYLPGGNLWYTRLAFERLILDQWEVAANPSARRKFARMKRKEMRENEREYWWAPGE